MRLTHGDADRSRQIPGANGYSEPNPDCRNGYTCEAAAAPAPEPAGLGGQCTDNSVCTDQLQAYFASNAGPCGETPVPHQVQVEMRYKVSTTLASLCPTKCLTPGCDGAPATPGGACADDAACGQVRGIVTGGGC